MKINEISGLIISESMKIHTELGPGLLESAYEACLTHELRGAGLTVERQKAIPLVYKEIKLECGYRADLVVNNSIIVEIKAVEAIHNIHCAQLLTYLRISRLPLGLIINFNVLSLKNGLKRVINGNINE